MNLVFFLLSTQKGKADDASSPVDGSTKDQTVWSAVVSVYWKVDVVGKKRYKQVNKQHIYCIYTVDIKNFIFPPYM